MTDLNKEREAFEQHLIDTGLVEFAGYGFDIDECNDYTHEPTNVAWGAWVIGLNRAKAQAVPDTHAVVPKQPTPKMIDATWDFDDEILEMSSNTRNEFIWKKMVEANVSGAEG